MIEYIIRRLFLIVPVLLGVLIITFLLMFVIPGDPISNMMGQRANDKVIERIRAELHLDDPWHIQFVRYVGRVIKGDLGKSYVTHRSVTKDILAKLPVTAKLAFSTMIVASTMGILIGIIAAVYHNTWIDRAAMVFALIFISTPVFWFGLILVFVFGMTLGWLPISGIGDGSLKYWILPAITLGTRSAAFLARMTRSTMLEVIRQDYIRTAQSKGLAEKVVIFKHALKNAMIPIITILGMQFASYLNGSVLTETIFAIPGFGRYVVMAINKRDFLVIAGSVLVGAIIFVFANLFVDLTYGILDPRIRYD
ncbi:MAG: ABC transporter permease [Halanaerobiales bacterium]|nr:ABC transporter permease [Halanaerobiales bacterium]